MIDLNTYMAGLRYAHSGSYEGNYLQMKRTVAGPVVGAYGVVADEWPQLAAKAGVPGAEWRNPSAQDFVVGTQLNEFYRRYGSWDLTTAAWYGGRRSADVLVRRGYGGIESIYNEQLADYVGRVNDAVSNAPADLPAVAPIIWQSGSGWVFPVAGENTWSPGGFLYRRSEGAISAGRTPIHEGIDIGAAKGTPIVSPVSGKVVSSTHGSKGGWQVKIMGDDGIIYFFSHMNEQPQVGSGSQVRAGQWIGSVGNSGNAQGTAPHLHFTMRHAQSGNLINPTSYLKGAEEGGGQFGGMALDESFGIATQPSRAQMMAQMFQSVSDAMAGGDRLDYRTLGVETEPAVEGGTIETIVPGGTERPVERFLNMNQAGTKVAL